MDQQEQREEHQEADIEIPTETKVSKKLTDITQKRVIVLIMTTIFALPFLVDKMYVDPFNSWDYELNLMEDTMYKTPQHLPMVFEQ